MERKEKKNRRKNEELGGGGGHFNFKMCDKEQGKRAEKKKGQRSGRREDKGGDRDLWRSRGEVRRRSRVKR